MEIRTMVAFITGLELNRLFYREVVGPLLAARFPDLDYSAALIGYGSDVLGYDTELSTDHEWGPRLQLFLDGSEESAVYRVGHALDQTFQQHLPATFRGYSTNFSTRKSTDGVRSMDPVAPGDSPRIDHHIQIWSVDEFLRWELGVDAVDHLSMGDWLTFPEQKLLEVTAGAVYHDGLGQLVALREQLAYYPHDIWLYRLAAQWRRIAQEEAFVGRSGDVGDELGSQLVAARLVYDVMRLCFLLERRYAPYSKWCGTAFGRLACAQDVGPQLRAVLAATTWQEREERLVHVYETVASAQNALAIAAPQDPSSRPYFGRPYQVIMADRFVTALIAAIQDPDVRWIAENLGLAGALDQWADSTDILSSAAVCRRAGAIYAVDSSSSLGLDK
jgi:hypothetical protein